MATEGNNSSIVAIVAIMVLLALGALVAWQMGLIGGHRGGGDNHGIDVNVR
jgi:hypothetical protein